MKLLIVADLHYTLPQFDWVLGAAHNYDAVILAGDLLDIGSMVDLGAQMVVVKGYLRRLRQATELLVCSGNHDLDGLGANGEKLSKQNGAAPLDLRDPLAALQAAAQALGLGAVEASTTAPWLAAAVAAWSHR